MAFKINGTTVITDARHLNNIVDADEGSAQAIQDAVPVPVNSAFVPSDYDLVNNPSETIQATTSMVTGTWSKPSGMDDKEALFVLLTEQGGHGNQYPYSTNWGFAGIGGRTHAIFTSAGDLNGSSYSVAPANAWSDWQGQVSTNLVSFTINGTTYSSSASGQSFVWTNSNSVVGTTSNANSYIVNTSGVLAPTNTNGFQRYNLSGTQSGVTSPAVDFPGGHGEGNYSQSGSAQVSNVSGNGGALSQAGFTPGGGGGGQNNTGSTNRGGYAQIRIWYASDTL